MDRASSAVITHSKRLPDRAVSASLGIGFLTSFYPSSFIPHPSSFPAP